MALLLGGCAAFIQLYFPATFTSEAELSFIERAHGLARLTASSLRPAVDFDDRDAAVRRLAELSSVKEAAAAAVFDRDGKAFASWGAGAIDPRAPDGFSAGHDRYVAREAIVTAGGAHG